MSVALFQPNIIYNNSLGLARGCSLPTPVWGSHLLDHKPTYGTSGTTLLNHSVQNLCVPYTSACSLNILCYHTLCSFSYLWLYEEGRDFGLWLTCHYDLWFSSFKFLLQILISIVQWWDRLLGGDWGVVTQSDPLRMPILHAYPHVNLLFTWLFWAEPILSLAWFNTDCGSHDLPQDGLANPVPESGSLSQSTLAALRNICWVQRIQRGSLHFTQQEVCTEKQNGISCTQKSLCMWQCTAGDTGVPSGREVLLCCSVSHRHWWGRLCSCLPSLWRSCPSPDGRHLWTPWQADRLW